AVARRAEAQQTARLTNVVQLSVRLGNLVHEMQKERGLTAVFMSSHGTKLGPDLDAQRTKVDGRRTDLESFLAQRRGDLSRAILDRLDPAVGAVGQLGTVRQQASALTAEPRKIIDYFSNTHAALLDSIGVLASASQNAQLGRMAIAYVAFLQA